MKQDELIEMLKKAGLSVKDPSWGYSERHHVAGWITDLESFVKLVAAKEREACAKVCEEQYEYYGHDHVFAAAIRARGQQ
jgi:hypothetical protein